MSNSLVAAASGTVRTVRSETRRAEGRRAIGVRDACLNMVGDSKRGGAGVDGEVGVVGSVREGREKIRIFVILCCANWPKWGRESWVSSGLDPWVVGLWLSGCQVVREPAFNGRARQGQRRLLVPRSRAGSSRWKVGGLLLVDLWCLRLGLQ